MCTLRLTPFQPLTSPIFLIFMFAPCLACSAQVSLHNVNSTQSTSLIVVMLTSAPLQPNQRRNRVSNLQVVKSSHGHLITSWRVHLDQSWGTRVGQGEHALVCQIMHTRDNQHLQWTNAQYLTQTAVGYLKTNKQTSKQTNRSQVSSTRMRKVVGSNLCGTNIRVLRELVKSR